MKTILTTLNAKYIHTSLALRWLYVANKNKFDITFKEFTIKENTDFIANELLMSNPDIIGIGVYIWNVDKTNELINKLKTKKPSIVIILGGPEVSYEPEFFIKNWVIDFVISGEGEFVLGDLLLAIKNKENTDIKSVSSKQFVNNHVAKASLDKLMKLPSPYMLNEDRGNLKNRIVYFETSRGCPYQCQYCLSSLEKGVRYFDNQYIFNNLTYLIQNESKTIKFLDRTFNLNKNHTNSIFNYLIQNHHPNLSLQFEIYADLLDDATIEELNKKLPKNFFRFEIGIQSTYEPTNKAIKRKQNFNILQNNIKKIMEGGKIDLHLDLIAGLPYESFDRFKQSFNDVFQLKAKELQLGFLKMLRGTNLRKYAANYGYVYNLSAPYEVISNNDISNDELKRIHEAEHALEKYWNSGKFYNTMNLIFNSYYKNQYFEFFDELGQFYEKHNYPHHGYQLEDLYRYLEHFLLSKNINVFTSLRTDYYNNFKVRPQGFWEQKLEKKKRKQLLYQIANDKEFLRVNDLNRKIVEKQAAIDPISNNEFLLTFFGVNNSKPFSIYYSF